MLLSKDEYIKKIAILYGANEKTLPLILKYHMDKFEKMYNAYIESDGKLIKLRDLAELENLKYIEAINTLEEKDAAFASKWIILPDLQKVLVKNILTDKYTKEQRFNCLCNHLVCPSISESLGMDSARYSIAQDKNGMYILTPSFLAEGETLKTGKEIKRKYLARPRDTIEEDLDYLERYVNSINGDNLDKQAVRQAYIKQTIFWYLIKNKDQAARNWGVIEGENFRFSPNYDYDFCFDTDENGPDNSRINNSNIESVITKYKKEDWFKKWFEDSVLKLDIDSNFDGIQNKIPKKYLSMYEQYKTKAIQTMQNRISRMKEIYMPIGPEIAE